MWVVGGSVAVACLAKSQDRLNEFSSEGCTCICDDNLWGVIAKDDVLNEKLGYLFGATFG